jgi:DNA polymerase-1
MDKFLVIDGNSLFHRCYHGVKPLSNKDGVLTHAILGFLNIYLKLKSKYKPSHIAVAFDRHEPTFRHELYAEYKGNREHMPDEFAQQLGYLKNILIHLGIKTVDCPRYEADDILGTISKVCEDSHIECYIASGDKDIFQLISDTVTIVYLKSKRQVPYDTQAFVEEFGFQPINIIDYKAVVGDPSDNYNGIKGIGEKTITPLIQQYGTIENIYANLDNIKLTPSQLKRFTDNRDEAMFCKQLATINRNAPISTNLEDYRYDGISNPSELLSILEYLELNKLIERLKLVDVVRESQAEDVQLDLCLDMDTPTTTPTIKVNTIPLATYFTTNSSYTDYLINDDTLYIYDNERIYQTNDPYIIIDYLQSNICKRTIGSKAHYGYADSINNIIMDAELCGYLLDTSSKKYTVKSLCETNNVHYVEELGELADIYSLPLLNDVLLSNIRKLEMDKLLALEIELSKVLADMEKVGVKIDVPTVKKYQVELTSILENLQEKIYLLAGREFNILSPQQLSEVLFEDLKLKKSKETSLGYSTSSDALEKLKGSHPIVPLIIEYKLYQKLKSTYLDGLLKCISSDGRIHTIFRQTETRTGRLSSAEPNLQNIPIRNDFAKNIRKFFIADDNRVLIDADYNQIELRLTAIMSKDTNMIDSFLKGKDIHTTTAMKIFNTSETEVTPQMRSLAKTINFGLIYGMGARKLSREINTTTKEAQQYIDSYFATYPNIQTFMNETIKECEKDGYVKTIMNRIRYVPEIRYASGAIKSAGERIAMNTPIQGSSADIIKLAMVRVYNRLKNENLDAKLILQVHDELLVECHKDCAETVAKLVKEEMENVMQLEIPLTVEVNIGGSWFDAH